MGSGLRLAGGVTDPQPLFAALSDPTRRALFERLSSQGPASATTLAAGLPVTRQAVAKHLAALDGVGLVKRTTVGREVRYAVILDPLADMTTWVTEVGSKWEGRLEQLRRSLGEDS
ncbi:MAG: metalloregulator ArsR/SmtB family transcription factor [Actinomycetota bacterium]|nr:metalloregulator ArsR/SmtB family transcription factor [Actinomycetota bacterium]